MSGNSDNSFPDFLIDVAEGGAGTAIHSNILNLKSNILMFVSITLLITSHIMKKYCNSNNSNHSKK
jgi:hypothetical protein